MSAVQASIRARTRESLSAADRRLDSLEAGVVERMRQNPLPPTYDRTKSEYRDYLDIQVGRREVASKTATLGQDVIADPSLRGVFSKMGKVQDLEKAAPAGIRWAETVAGQSYLTGLEQETRAAESQLQDLIRRYNSSSHLSPDVRRRLLNEVYSAELRAKDLRSLNEFVSFRKRLPPQR